MPKVKITAEAQRAQRKSQTEKSEDISQESEAVVISHWLEGSTNDHWPLTNGDKIRKP
jgi:hypothetical protein